MFNIQLLEVVIKNELCKNRDAAKKMKIEYSVLNIEYSFFPIKQKKKKHFNINFNVHFFVSTNKRTKEIDPKRMLLPAPETEFNIQYSTFYVQYSTIRSSN